MFQAKTHIFFDLDHTLWDYNRNCEEALIEIFEIYELNKFGIESPEKLIKQFHIENNRLWDLYDSRQITAAELRHRRFRDVFTAFDIENHTICDQLHESYMEISPNKPYLLPNAKEILEYLKPKYRLFIITNGIASIQSKKMRASGIEKYFEAVICSEKANARKPEKEIFQYALNLANTTAGEAVMIGDNFEVDILGAKLMGIDSIYFSPQNKDSTLCDVNTISQLNQLKNFL